MPKIGMVRVKAMSLLKTLLVAVSKIKTEQSLISHLLKIKVIDTMLYVIKTYPFCCLAHQQSILILNALKESFDQDDVATLKKFILVELTGQAQFEFPSGRKCSGPNMGQITQIAFELRNLTQQALDEQSSEAEDEQDVSKLAQRKEMNKWVKFCKSKIDKIEKVWNKKLEDVTTGDDSDDNTFEA
jgi:hypothetical protein